MGAISDEPKNAQPNASIGFSPMLMPNGMANRASAIGMIDSSMTASYAPIAPLIDRKKAIVFMDSHKELGKPWFGELMAGPQLMAYFIQLNYWMEKYHLSV